MSIQISYPGNKANRAILPKLVNLVPPCKEYIELFLGSAGLSRYLRLPPLAIGIEKDPLVIRKFKSIYPSGLVVKNDCGISWMQKHLPCSEDTFIYADPPYPKSSRRSTADIYGCEMSDDEHLLLTKLLLTTGARVMVSTYENPIYSKAFANWNKKVFRVCTHGKPSYEVVYYNYQVPEKKQDYRFVGENKTDRQRIKRKINRWCNRLMRLPGPEREAISDYLIRSIESKP